MQRIGNILPSFLNNLGIDEAVKLKILRKKWGEIFSYPLLEHIYPKELKGEVLYITVNSHAWLNELKLLKGEFLSKLIPYGIKDVEFKFGKIYTSKRTNEGKTKTIRLSIQQQEWINDIVKEANDDEIKTTIKRLLTRYLERVNETIKGENNERF